jgi:gliding motility-associated-like protein
LLNLKGCQRDTPAAFQILMVKKLLSLGIIILFIILFFQASAQREGNIWYFGNHAGIDFNTGAAFPLTDGALSTLDGCATISNAAGKLLFYTDGVTVYDRTHSVMPNGKGLAGGLSSTQSAIIIPKPFSTTLYYIFTVDYQMGPKGLEYSIVDMSQNSGNGDIVKKNVLIRDSVCEKLTAVQDSNKRDIWVIAHDSKSSYLAYLVTDSGVRTKPVVSSGGVYVGGSTFNAIGYLKVSSGGMKLASAIKFLNLIEVGNFDNATGKISSLKTIPNINTAYGLEFSPDNTKLYATNYFDHQLYQFDVTFNDINAIISSKITIFTSPSALSAIQQAPDGKLYVSRDAHSKMGVISSPNQPGKACSYDDLGFDLNGKTCYSGLPTFIQSFFIPNTDFVFITKTNTIPSKWYWNFDDPVSTFYNTDSVRNPSHIFSSAGTYHVILILTINGLEDTFRKTVIISDVPKMDLGPDKSLCRGEKVTLRAGSTGYKYLWNTGDTIPQITADSTGKYWVQAKNGSCVRSDTVNLTFTGIGGNYKLGNDTVLCKGMVLPLTKSIKGAHILWSTGSTDTTIYITKTGYYWIRITVANCSTIDSILVFFEDPPAVFLGKDTILCEGETMVLDSKVKNANYLWSTGALTQAIKVHEGGYYWVRVNAGGCDVFDTIDIHHCKAHIFMPDVFTPNSDSLNDWFKPYGTDIARFELSVLNRWGEIVYRGDNRQGWDGKFHGNMCPAGIYGYKLIYREYEGDVLYDRQLTGKVYLAR